MRIIRLLFFIFLCTTAPLVAMEDTQPGTQSTLTARAIVIPKPRYFRPYSLTKLEYSPLAESEVRHMYGIACCGHSDFACTYDTTRHAIITLNQLAELSRHHEGFSDSLGYMLSSRILQVYHNATCVFTDPEERERSFKIFWKIGKTVPLQRISEPLYVKILINACRWAGHIQHSRPMETTQENSAYDFFLSLASKILAHKDLTHTELTLLRSFFSTVAIEHDYAPVLSLNLALCDLKLLALHSSYKLRTTSMDSLCAHISTIVTKIGQPVDTDFDHIFNAVFRQAYEHSKLYTPSFEKLDSIRKSLRSHGFSCPLNIKRPTQATT